MKLIFVLLLAMLLATNSRQKCPTLTTDHKIYDFNFGQEANQVYQGQQDFSLDLLQAISKVKPHENLLFSPYSIYNSLLTVYFLSGGQTEKHLKKLLHLNTKQSKIAMYKSYKDQTKETRKNDPYKFININKIFFSDRIAVRDCIPGYFPYELIKTPFASVPEAVRSAINKWASNYTYYMIEDLLPPGTIDSTTNLMLVNAGSFRDIWDYKFPLENTRSDIFHVNFSKQVTVDMMHVVINTFNYDVSETLDAHILVLTYKLLNSMYILLPLSEKDDAIDNVLKELTLERFKSCLNTHNAKKKMVHVSLPKFSMEQTIDLQPILESLGVGNLFESDADFTILFNDGQNISVDKAIHKSKIRIIEKGAKTAEVQSRDYSYSDLWDYGYYNDYDEPVHFNCNRPFLFFIFDHSTDTILLAGVYRKPDKLK